MTTYIQTKPQSESQQASSQYALGGRSEIVMVVLLAALSALLIAGSMTMEVMDNSKPGPQFTPMLIGIGLAVVALFLLIDVLRNPEKEPPVDDTGYYVMSIDMLHDLAGMSDAEDSFLHSEILEAKRAAKEQREKEPAETEQRVRVRSDWKTLLGVVGSCLGFIALLPYLGWVITSAALFWLITYFLGSTRPVFDIWVGLIMASIVQLTFGGLMGLNLPAGFWGGF